MSDPRSDHASNPDQLMASALGVCWHSPTSDRWPCTPAASSPPPRDGEVCECRCAPDCPRCIERNDHARWCPAAPSEPPAADSPTPGTEVCPGDFKGDSMVIPCQHPKGHPPLQDGSGRYWRHGQGSMHWGRMKDYRPAAPSPVAPEPPAEAQQDDAATAVAVWTAKAPSVRSRERQSDFLDGYRAARPSADTETLRRVRKLLPRIEDLADFEEGGERHEAASSVRTVLKHLRAALDGSR